MIGGGPPPCHRGPHITELLVLPGQAGGGVDIKVDMLLQLQQYNVVLQSSLRVVVVLVNYVVSNIQSVLRQYCLLLLIQVMVAQLNLNSLNINKLLRSDSEELESAFTRIPPSLP